MKRVYALSKHRSVLCHVVLMLFITLNRVLSETLPHHFVMLGSIFSLSICDSF